MSQSQDILLLPFFPSPSFLLLASSSIIISLLIMEDRPIKGNTSGQYDMTFVDPTNDIAAYYGGMTELADQVEKYLETVTYHSIQPGATGKTELYGEKVKQESYLDHCSVCLELFSEGEQVKVLPCRHCFHQDCVTPWFSLHSHCPNCRFQLPPA